MSSDLFFNYLAMRYKGTEFGNDKATFVIVMPDRKEQVVLIVSNGTVTPRFTDRLPANPTAKITAPRTLIMAMTAGDPNMTFKKLIADKKIKVEGNTAELTKFFDRIDQFDPWFNIIEP